jgi:hypothetical protein
MPFFFQTFEETMRQRADALLYGLSYRIFTKRWKSQTPDVEQST